MTTIHQIPCPIPFPLKSVNCYYIEDSRPALIDAGLNTKENLDCIEKSINRAGGDIRDIQRIVITHAHTDHAGLAGKLAEISGADVFVHRLDHPKFFSGDPDCNAKYFKSFRDFLHVCGVPEFQCRMMAKLFDDRVKQWVCPIERPNLLSGGETIVFDEFELRVIHSPGHTAGSISLFDEAGALLFSGDTLLEKITPNPVVELSPLEERNGYRSIERFSASLKWIAKQDVSRILPGHGPSFSRGRQRAGAILRHFDQRREKILRLIGRYAAGQTENAGMTLFQLAHRMFPKLREMELFLGLSEAYAYVQLLESESLVETRREKDVCIFRPSQTFPCR